MLTADGPKVIEFNVRLGDPEAQVMLPLIDEPLLPLLVAAARRLVRSAACRIGTERLVGVVLASRGYPESSESGQPIHGVDDAEAMPGRRRSFTPAPRVRGGQLVTAGGRVLTVVGRGADFAEAIARAYAGVAQIRSTGMQYRRDIGRKALRRRARNRTSHCMKYSVDHLRLPRQPGRLARLRGGAARRAAPSRSSPDAADLVVVNTCSVTATADQGARQTIRRIARDNPAARIVVTGCYATRRPDEVAALPERRCASSATTTSRVLSVVTDRAEPRTAEPVRSTTARALRRWRRQLRRGDRAGRRRPDRLHAARADRLRRTVLLLHHPDDARRAAQRAARRCARARSSASPRPVSRKSR